MEFGVDLDEIALGLCHVISMSYYETAELEMGNSMSFLQVLFVFPCWNMTWILGKFNSWNFHGIC